MLSRSMILWATVFITVFVTFTSCLDNGLGLTPPMGWNSWNHFGCYGINENLIKQVADAMVDQGFLNAGYKYLNVDDCWASALRYNNTLVSDPITFPSGIKALADYVHEKGLLFGIYADAGSYTCDSRAGSLGFEEIDANTFAYWGVDYLKYDNCNDTNIPSVTRYLKMRNALNATGRPIFYSICDWGVDEPYIWGSQIGNSWRTTVDIYAQWKSILSTLDQQRNITSFSKPGGWNDPDMLEVGNGVFTLDEQKSHFSFWAALKAPLILGLDPRNPSSDAKTVLFNKEIIAVNQDPLGKSVEIVDHNISYEIWTGQLSDGYVALLFNRAEISINITLDFYHHCNLTGNISVQDLWDEVNPFKGSNIGSYSSLVPTHGVTVLKLSTT